MTATPLLSTITPTSTSTGTPTAATQDLSGTRAVTMGMSPVAPLPEPVTLVISGPGRTTRITLVGPPDAWIAAISAQSGITGIDGVITTADTLLDDDVRPDPLGEGYLLLYTHLRGRAARLTAGAEQPADGLGFTLTHSEGEGRDRAARRAGPPLGR